MIKKQFTLYLDNRPGSLANVARKLAKAGINIVGISVSASTDVGLVQVVVNNAAKTRKLLKESGIAFSTQNICLLTLKDEPGVLYDGVAKLAKDGVNVNYIYATGCSSETGRECYVVISAPDLNAVEKAWSV